MVSLHVCQREKDVSNVLILHPITPSKFAEPQCIQADQILNPVDRFSLWHLLTIALRVLLADPPKKPRILGYVPGTYLTSGQSVSLSCLAQGGNPAASLTWYKDADERDSKTKVEDDVARSVLSFSVDSRDNEAVYRCDSSNPVLDDPDSVNVTLLVYCEQDTGRGQEAGVQQQYHTCFQRR